MSSASILYTRAQQYIPGGVNSPVRAFHGVGGTPKFLSHAQGAYVTDSDGQQYIDYVGSWGPMILGHRHDAVIAAVRQAIEHGLSFGAPCALEVELAAFICEKIPAIEQIRMVNSGTEATMSAIRLARAATQRDNIIKFAGCYHGHHDALLVHAGSGALTFGVPSSPGVPQSFVQHTLTAEFNHLDSVQALFEAHPQNIAAIIVEPIAGNMGCIPPSVGFLKGLRELCDRYGSLLIFDEVITGFRVHAGGAASLYGITPDLITYGKIIGGGMPVGAFGGRKAIMEYLAPVGPVYQAGTLSGNPVAMAAGLATLKTIQDTPDFYTTLADKTDYLVAALREAALAYQLPVQLNSVCGLFSLFFTEQPEVSDYKQVTACNTERFKHFFHSMLKQGIYLAPSAFESGFVSIAHDKKLLDQTIQAATKAFGDLKSTS